jgi:hypothetical protein
MFNNLNQIIAKLNLNYASVQVVKHHPRPSAVTTFNARLTDHGGGYALWNRRQDNLRHVMSQCIMQNDKFLRKNPGFIHANSSETAASSSQPIHHHASHQNFASRLSNSQRSAFVDPSNKQRTSNDHNHHQQQYFNFSPMKKESLNSSGQQQQHYNSTFVQHEHSPFKSASSHRPRSGDGFYDPRSANLKRNSNELTTPHHGRLKMPRMDDYLSLNLIESDAAVNNNNNNNNNNDDDLELIELDNNGEIDEEIDEAVARSAVAADDDEINYIYVNDNNFYDNHQPANGQNRSGSQGSKSGPAASNMFKPLSQQQLADTVSSSMIQTNRCSSSGTGSNSGAGSHSGGGIIGKQKLLSSSLSLSPSPSSSSSASSSSNNGLTLSSLIGHHHSANQFNAPPVIDSSILNSI